MVTMINSNPNNSLPNLVFDAILYSDRLIMANRGFFDILRRHYVDEFVFDFIIAVLVLTSFTVIIVTLYHENCR